MTDYGWFDFDAGGMILREIASDLTVDQVREATEARFRVADDLQTLPVG